MAIAVLALIGLFDAAYLSIERVRGAALACPIGGGCETVQSSPYALLLGVPVAFLGVAGYLLLFGVAMLSLYRHELAGVALRPALLALASAAVLFAIYLTYLQIAAIGAICFWCAVSALLDLGIWALALLDWRALHHPRETITNPPAG